MPAAIVHIPASASPAAPLRLTTTTRLVAAREHTLTGVRGLTWVTLDNDLRDTVLASGQRYTVPAHRMVVVTSLRPGAAFEVSFAASLPGSASPVGNNAVLRRHRPRVSAWQRVWRPLGAALSAFTHRGSPA